MHEEVAKMITVETEGFLNLVYGSITCCCI